MKNSSISFFLEVYWDRERYFAGHPPPHGTTEQKIGSLAGKTFPSLDALAQEIDSWGWKRADPKEWPGHNFYEWENPDCQFENIYLPDKVRVSWQDFPFLRRWPIIYFNTSDGAVYELAQIVVKRTE